MRISLPRFPRLPAGIAAISLLACLITQAAFARSFAVVTYNVENLFDADNVAVYDDYQPVNYTPAHLAVKIANIAKVLARVNKGAGPEIAMFNEIELDQTPDSTVKDYDKWLASIAGTTADAMLAQSPLPAELAGLPSEAWLLKACADAGLTGYHVATTDERPGNHEDGRSLAIRNLVFSRFPITAVRSHPTPNARAILEVTLDVDGYPLTVFQNHWKSGAGDPETEVSRRENAKTLRGLIDGLVKADPNADFIIGGDLNSHYNQKQRYRTMRTTGINDILGSQGNELAIRGKDRDLYNLWFELPSDQRGSDIYKNEWGTLMHLILSRGLFDQNGVQYEEDSFAVLKFSGLNADAFGRPNRWSRGKIPAGFSDHFPVYARFKTVDSNARDKWMPLTRPSTTDEGSGAVIPVAMSTVDLFATALKPADLPKGTDIRDGTYNGRIFLIEEPCYVNEKGHVKVKVGDLEYDVFSHNKDFRNALRDRARTGAKLRFYGELGQFKGAWQFVLQDKNWLK
jgi:endonuclease/exonuclease/phosphatase family metal-dependent hydrolase